MAVNGKGSAGGWVMVAVALAIPGLIFYFWWSNLNNARRQQMTQTVRKRLPGGASLFEGSPTQDKLTNPIAGEPQASTAPAAGAPATAAAPAGAPAAGPGAAASGPAAPSAPAAPPPGAPPSSAPSMAAPAAAAEPGPAAAAAVSPITRDPTLSPFDVARIEQALLHQQESRQEVQQEARKVRRQASPPIENSIDLQGIITDAEGRHRAIVNGEMVREGDAVAGGVRISRITPRGVVFIHRNRRFTKTMSQ